jgi:fumarate reductase subunit D
MPKSAKGSIFWGLTGGGCCWDGLVGGIMLLKFIMFAEFIGGVGCVVVDGCSEKSKLKRSLLVFEFVFVVVVVVANGSNNEFDCSGLSVSSKFSNKSKLFVNTFALP